jgi:hypothetical protein
MTVGFWSLWLVSIGQSCGHQNCPKEGRSRLIRTVGFIL